MCVDRYNILSEIAGFLLNWIKREQRFRTLILELLSVYALCASTKCRTQCKFFQFQTKVIAFDISHVQYYGITIQFQLHFVNFSVDWAINLWVKFLCPAINESNLQIWGFFGFFTPSSLFVHIFSIPTTSSVLFSRLPIAQLNADVVLEWPLKTCLELPNI